MSKCHYLWSPTGPGSNTSTQKLHKSLDWLARNHAILLTRHETLNNLQRPYTNVIPTLMCVMKKTCLYALHYELRLPLVWRYETRVQNILYQVGEGKCTCTVTTWPTYTQTVAKTRHTHSTDVLFIFSNQFYVVFFLYISFGFWNAPT